MRVVQFKRISCQIEEDARLLRITQELEWMAEYVLNQSLYTEALEIIWFSWTHRKH